MRKLEAGGVAALFITVDAPALGRREKDMRMKVAAQKSAVQSQDGVDTSQVGTYMLCFASPPFGNFVIHAAVNTDCYTMNLCWIFCKRA